MKACIFCGECQHPCDDDDHSPCTEELRIETEVKERNARGKKKPLPKHAGYELGPREFTLTYSPKWAGYDETTVKPMMKRAVERLMKYYKDEILELRAVGEIGKENKSHVHCAYHLTGGVKMTDKNLQRVWHMWNPKIPLGKTGFQGGHHANIQRESDFRGYIEKDIDTAWLDIKFQREEYTNALRNTPPDWSGSTQELSEDEPGSCTA
jgi:hypothetical protein